MYKIQSDHGEAFQLASRCHGFHCLHHVAMDTDAYNQHVTMDTVFLQHIVIGASHYGNN